MLKKTIKIIISENPFAHSSATSNRWRTLIEGLSESGVAIEIYIISGFNSLKEKEIFNISGTFKNIKYLYLINKVVSGYFYTRYYNYLGYHFYYKNLKSKILAINGLNQSIIWTDSTETSFKIATEIRKHIPEAKLFLEMSEFLDIHKYNKGNFLQRWKADSKQKYFEKKAFHKYDGLALMTKTLIKHYNTFSEPSPKLLHLPMTVDLDRFKNAEAPLQDFQKPYIAFIGVMNDNKDGVNILIQAFSIIAKDFPDYNLYLIGGWNYDTPSHLKLIKNLKLEDRIFWKGVYNRDQIPTIIKNASLLALPRPDSKQAQGGFPTKLGEYLATGNPVCVTTVGEIPDYLTDGKSAYFAEPGNVDSFAKAMRRALNNPEEAKEIGGNGLKVAETYFNQEIQAKTLYNFLLSL
ncbi:MAG: glycosyltransferase family 4 protein [Bacteroidales bacterium]|jgi:glycosyltransferase involved in cell wall biosynthesis|nr:glycosyltransferase family 4 protein [Bacteroidales bacterium]